MNMQIGRVCERLVHQHICALETIISECISTWPKYALAKSHQTYVYIQIYKRMPYVKGHYVPIWIEKNKKAGNRSG